MKIYFSALLLLSLICSEAIAQSSEKIASEKIGQIRTLEGAASIQRNGTTLPAAVAEPIYHGDLIRTGKPGSVGIVLTDNTSISLGSNSEFSMSEYAFEPKAGKFAMVMRMVKGTFAYASGLIGKLAPDAIQLKIPDATIAVRGTKLLIEIKE